MSFTWSYSRLKAYETCPLRHYHYDVLKDTKEPESGAMVEGNAAHRAFEDRIRKNTKLPMPLVQHEPMMAKLAGLPGEIYAEQRLGLTSEFKPCDFFAKNVWFRTVIDYCNIQGTYAAVIDYKTGKPNKDETQLRLMSTTVMHYMPEVKRVRARLLFVNHDHAERMEFTRKDIPETWADTLPRVAKLQMAIEARDFPPKPGGLCKRYCAVTSCTFHGRGTQ